MLFIGLGVGGCTVDALSRFVETQASVQCAAGSREFAAASELERKSFSRGYEFYSGGADKFGTAWRASRG